MERVLSLPWCNKLEGVDAAAGEQREQGQQAVMSFCIRCSGGNIHVPHTQASPLPGFFEHLMAPGTSMEQFANNLTGALACYVLPCSKHECAAQICLAPLPLGPHAGTIQGLAHLQLT